MENKIKLIKQIVQFHPSCGAYKGWSHYTGGMKDSGDWFWEKMIDVPNEELQSFLDLLISERDKPEVPKSAEEIYKSKIILILPNGNYVNQWEHEQLENFAKGIETKILFGEYKK